MTRDFQSKLQSSKCHTWNGFAPFYAGCFYGDSVCLGGEERYIQCYDFRAGVVDEEWWVVDELEKLTQEEKDELLRILKRNKEFHDYKKSIVPELARVLGVEQYQVYRVPNKTLYEFVNLVHSHSNEAIAKKAEKARERWITKPFQETHGEY
jgi:hypothetical protein